MKEKFVYLSSFYSSASSVPPPLSNQQQCDHRGVVNETMDQQEIQGINLVQIISTPQLQTKY